MRILIYFFALSLAAAVYAQQNSVRFALPKTAAVQDKQQMAEPDQVQLGGLLGERFGKNEKNRLLVVNEHDLLDGYKNRPGSHPWIGEHVGKWLHAATLAWAGTKDPALRTKLDRVAHELIATQEPDGYLGTYVKGKRFGLYEGADWDVWSHKYCLIGLLTYEQYTSDRNAISACKKVGDILIATFGPGKKSILSAGTHMGMAATSILEPVVLLYRATGEIKYLDFANYIVSSWDEQGGPRVLTSLLAKTPVNKVANGKAYEMTSNIVGLCELYRATGKKPYLDAALWAWEDIAKNHLYITGSGSAGEHWQGPHIFPTDMRSSICETCVTVTWEQLNVELLRLTSQARFAEELEKTIYNHLLGAQKPTGDDWSYYTPLEGTKPYDSGVTCCHSSGPRGVSLIPTFAYGVQDNGVNVNIYGAGKATLQVAGGQMALEQITSYPLSGNIILKLTPTGINRATTLRLRVPAWSAEMKVTVNDQPQEKTAVAGEYLGITRKWKTGDRISLKIDMSPRVLVGDNSNTGRAAVQWGPLALAADLQYNPQFKRVRGFALAGDTASSAGIRLLKPSGKGEEWDNPVWLVRGEKLVSGRDNPVPIDIKLTPYYNAGRTGSQFSVWLLTPAALKLAAQAASTFSIESRSHVGNQPGSICDGDPGTFVVTFDGAKHDIDWFAVQADKAVPITQVVFVQGTLFHDGGWFDSSAGKPVIEVQKTADGPWEKIGVLESYPETTSADRKYVLDGKRYELKLSAPIAVCAVRIIGQPAGGDHPTQSFASCAELEAH